MVDIRPLAHVIGALLIFLACMMLAPALVDFRAGLSNSRDFLESALITGGIGLAMRVATANSDLSRLDTRQAYLLTVMVWAGLPLFACLPFALGAPGLGFTDAYFEAASGLTTTGATVIVGLDHLPPGMNLWRGMLNWIGGLGIAFVAMIFLPVMRVGGMQFFRTEGFDTLGKALPRATDIARALLAVYVGLTLLCVMVYQSLGMSGLDAVVNGAATIATGGFSPSDASFGKYPGAAEYAGALFMLLGSFPYILYARVAAGQSGAVLWDAQIWALLRWTAYAVGSVTLWRVLTSDMGTEQVFRETLFNLVSIITGTGFFTGSFAGWGGYSMAVALIVGLIGGCSGSSSGALSVFRVQVAWAAVQAQIARIHSPERIAPVRYAGRRVEDEVINALMLYVTGYILILGVFTVAMSLVGVDMISALFGIWMALGNIGYGYGPMLGDTGTFRDFPDAAKWLMTLAMLLGRLGLLAVLVVALPSFWRA
ncbi:TrkH family potassium uptake protein [Pseudotabrizicola algicola]|uniref:Trk system potassium uptake protein n=1 Tax=Pseudotabrizicola algicola TaxID=2709381 RepID=A0A6B3RHM7_9RHOB|nr:TrkH family potassium uptake protein [Pseudotabrizicola algicola]NEX45544.1 TrkH family potassium uptake protein [Pseudotabrizicola algicola]